MTFLNGKLCCGLPRRVLLALEKRIFHPYFSSVTYPPINIGSTPEQVEIYLFAAGLNPETLDISIQQNLLTVAGDRKLQVEEGADYYRKERYDGGFRRVVTLPEDVDPDQVEASYRDGVLHVTIKRRESTRPRQITVK
jgi:HSP20 family protein